MITPPPIQAIPRARWYRIGLLLFLCQLMGHIDRNNIGVAGPALSAELGLSSTALGVLLSAFFWGYVVMQVPGGWLASHFSPKRVLVVILLIWGAAAIASGLATSFSTLVAARVVIGLAEGALFPTITVLIANWFPRKEHARAMGLAILSLPVASIIMSPIAGWLIQVWGYHVMFIAMAVPAIILATAVAVGLGDSPATDRWLTQGEREHLLVNVTAAPTDVEHQTLLQVIRKPSILILGLIYFLWQSGIYAFILWLPSVISQASKSGIGMVGVLSAIPFVFGAIALFLTARGSDRSAKARVGFIAGPLVLAGVALLAQHFISGGLWINIALLCVCAIGIFAPFGPWWAWVLRLAPPNQVGSAGGVVNAIGNLGGIVGPIAVGAVAAGGDLRNGFYVLGFALLLAAAVAIVLNAALQKRSRVGQAIPSKGAAH